MTSLISVSNVIRRLSKALSKCAARQRPFWGFKRCCGKSLHGKMWLATTNSSTGFPVMQHHFPEHALHGPHHYCRGGFCGNVARHILRLGLRIFRPRWPLHCSQILELRFAEYGHLIPVVVELAPDPLIAATVPRQAPNASGPVGWVQ